MVEMIVFNDIGGLLAAAVYDGIKAVWRKLR